MSQRPSTEAEALTELNRLFIKSLRALKDAGQADEACRIAAEGWSAIRHVNSPEAERITAAMHYLTGVTGKATRNTPDTER